VNATIETLPKFKTTAAYISGAICGRMWMPAIMAEIPLKMNIRGTWGFFDKGDTFSEALRSLLMRKGGHFQNSQFTADTVLRVERRRQTAKGYEVHVWERELTAICGCAELVNTPIVTLAISEWKNHEPPLSP
jgi:hypothetical protein